MTSPNKKNKIKIILSLNLKFSTVKIQKLKTPETKDHKNPKMSEGSKVFKAYDIKDPLDKLAITNLWHGAEIRKGFRTRVCCNYKCTAMDCVYSHIKIRGYPAVRCTPCSVDDCINHHITFRTIMVRGSKLELYTICRRISFEFEDMKLFARKREREQSVPNFPPVINPIPFNFPPPTNNDNFNLPRPPINYLSPTRLQPDKTRDHYTMAVINNTSANEERESMKVSLPYKPQVQSMIKRTDGDITVYYFRSTSTTKKALISMVSADEFKGQIKISEQHLQKAILKLPDDAIIAMKAELKDVPGAIIPIGMAELRLENARLQKEIDDAKNEK